MLGLYLIHFAAIATVPTSLLTYRLWHVGPFLGNELANTFPRRYDSWTQTSLGIKQTLLRIREWKVQTLANQLIAVESTGVSMDTSIYKHFDRIPLRYISGRSDKNLVIRKVNLNQVSQSRRKTRREDSRSPIRMERVLCSHLFRAV
jgi:hypothetical protein